MWTALEELLDERSMDGLPGDEVVRLLGAPGNGDSSLELFRWWQNNETRFTHISIVAKDVLAIHSSSVASESRLSWVSKLISDHRQSLEDDFIAA